MAGACEQKLHFCILFINLKEWLCCAEVRKCRNKEKFSVKVYWSTGHGQECRMEIWKSDKKLWTFSFSLEWYVAEKNQEIPIKV